MLKLLIPCLFILTLSVSTYMVYTTANENYSFNHYLQNIQEHNHSESAITKAWNYLNYRKATLAPEPNTPEAQQLANLYFRLGEVLLPTPYSDQAIAAYQQTIDLEPGLHHGWPFFQMGIIYERNNQLEEAHHIYQKVADYDFGQLSLQAGYRTASIQLKQGNHTINAYPLYAFFRYFNHSQTDSLLPFQEIELTDSNNTQKHSTFVHAMIQSYKGSSQEALSTIKKYLEHNPNDYAAQYYRDQIQNQLLPYYPPHGNLLVDPYAPLTFQNGFFKLIDKGHIIADFYVGQPDLALQLSISIKNPNQHQGQLMIHSNQDLHSFAVQDSVLEITLPIQTQTGKNIVDLHFYSVSPERQTNLNWIHVTELSLSPVENQNAL